MLRIAEAPSPNFNERLQPVDMLVLHYTGMADGPSALARLCDYEAEVSAHYLVEEDGSIIAMVPETQRAWHAGRSLWRGQSDLNSRSIGIEIVNGGHDFGLPDFPDVQIAAVIELAGDIVRRLGIPQTRIVGHSDIAPGRKTDPGERFPWRRLAEAGLGLWPDAPAPGPYDAEAFPHALSAIGYALEPAPEEGWDGASLADAAVAFQRRWRPADVTGRLDDETLGLAEAVASLYRREDVRNAPTG
jgi:N-acetylmuramoyl-L-alanine amidase